MATGTDPLIIDTPSPVQAGIIQYQPNFRHSSPLQSSSSSHSLSDTSLHQEVMKDRIRKEFKGSTFLVDLSAEGAPFYAHPDSIQAVLGRLSNHYGFTDATLLSDEDSSVDSPRFPPGGFQGTSYRPLVHFLNAIVNATNDCLPPSPRYLSDLHFDHHGWEMEEAYTTNSHQPLSPEVLGLLRSPTSQRQKVSWNDVAIIVEANDHIPELIVQLSTYARSYLTVDRRRSFAPAIGFNHKTLEIFFFAFHRSGLSSSGPISLRTPEGFESLVKYMVGILSIRDEEGFGLDMTRIGNVFRINERDYEIARPIWVRKSVCGRATAVYSLKLHTGGQDNPFNLRSRTLILADGVTALPDRIVYKSSYQTEGHRSEGQLFSEFRGQFGIIDVIGFYICGQEEPFGNTESLVRNGSFWDFTQGGSGTPEKRYLHCTAMSFECLPLLDIFNKEAGIPSPAELVETILHAMIGHYNLFIGGVLHRDVSQGNILRLRVPIERSRGRSAYILEPALGKDVNLSKCRGFLVDGDHSIEWRQAPLTPSIERTGTLPFMSERLLYAWHTSKPVTHTAVDDLESFLWVLFWALVHILYGFGTIRNVVLEKQAERLSSSNILEIFMRKYTIQFGWDDVVFKELLREWFDISHKASFAVEEHLCGSEGLEEYCRTVYMEYIQTGFKHLESIRRYSNWNAVIEASHQPNKGSM